MKRNLDNRVEILIPMEEPALIGELRAVFDSHVNDQRSTWDMAPYGSYVQRRPEEGSETQGTQEALIDVAEMRLREATRLRKRKPRSIGSRNLR